uniref:Uncharacterized mitochondrial protein AtMg00810-like n=1 Tax=Nicotiana tabacum TaxID=4097 RepID=A0A1S4AT25_TOBAC|nr:PREDICTED: uncharacterized mitochondrial protein AtMg00810-like [Nicotiana tabacum]
MEVSPGLVVEAPSLMCKLNKSMYGLKQESRQLYHKLTEALCSRGYTHSMLDNSLFYKKTEVSVVFAAVYVDDVLVTGTHLQDIESLKTFLHNTFKIKDLERLHYFLGLEVQYTEKGVLMSQKKFTMDLLKEFGCIDCPPMTSPLDSSMKLKADEGAPLAYPSYYRKLI